VIAGAIVALAAVAALFVLAPLRRPTATPAGGAEEPLNLEEEAARQILRDIELDHATGKLSDADYAALRAGPSTRDGGSI